MVQQSTFDNASQQLTEYKNSGTNRKRDGEKVIFLIEAVTHLNWVSVATKMVARQGLYNS